MWNQEVPTLNAKNFYCKFKIFASEEITSKASEQDIGHIYIEGEQYGFDEEVFVFVQPKGQWVDYSSRSPVNDITTIYKAYFGRKFLIPAEYDVMVSFAPIRWERGSENALSGLTVSEGGYRMRIMHQMEITED